MHVALPMMSREEDRALALTVERNQPSLLNYCVLSISTSRAQFSLVNFRDIEIWAAEYLIES